MTDPSSTLTPRQLLAERVQSIQEDSVLVVHGLNAGDGAWMRGLLVHGSP